MFTPGLCTLMLNIGAMQCVQHQCYSMAWYVMSARSSLMRIDSRKHHYDIYLHDVMTTINTLDTLRPTFLAIDTLTYNFHWQTKYKLELRKLYGQHLAAKFTDSKAGNNACWRKESLSWYKEYKLLQSNVQWNLANTFVCYHDDRHHALKKGHRDYWWRHF